MKIVIIGGVAAGMSAASKLRRLDKEAEIIVLEKGREISYGACGLPYWISEVNPEEDLLRIRKIEAFLKMKIEVRIENEVTALDWPNKKLLVCDANGKMYEETYDQCVIACGSKAIFPKIKGHDLADIYTLKTIEDANRIKEAIKDKEMITIIGGGYIGLELCESFHTLNKKVRIIEKSSHLLNNFDLEISERVEKYCAEMGIELCLNEEVIEFFGDTHIETIKTKTHEYACECVIMAIGVTPNTSFLKDSGLELLENGAIKTNEYMETSIKDIYAGGDCTNVIHRILKKPVYLPLGTNANKQGKYIAENILGKRRAFDTCLGSAMMKVDGLEIARCGISEQEAFNEGLVTLSHWVEVANHAPYYPNPSLIGFKLIYEKHSKILLGAQLIGYQGVALRMDALAVCITQRMTCEEIANLDFGYAPPFAMPWDAIAVACGSVR